MNSLQEPGARVVGTLDALAKQPKIAVAAAALTTLLVLYLVNTAFTWYRLSHLPGPFWAGVSKFWMIREALKQREPATMKALIYQHGECPFART